MSHWLRLAVTAGLSASLAALLLNVASADEGCCSRCGSCATRKVCRLVCEEKTVTVTCWGYEDEDFCLPGPSTPGCCHVERVCAECDPQGKVRVLPKCFHWREWEPAGCATLATRRKLMRRTETKTVPSYKWVVEEVCSECLSVEER